MLCDNKILVHFIECELSIIRVCKE